MNEATEQTVQVPEFQKSRVAVIGAGIAGLAAAVVSRQHHLHVSVLEKSRGVGGRTATRREGGHHFDHGAPFFTVHDETFQRHVDTWVNAGIVAPWRGRFATYEDDRLEADVSDAARFVGVPAMNALARHLAGDLNISFQSRVDHVTRDNDQWLLKDVAQNELGKYDVLLVAVPPEQAKGFLQNAPKLSDQKSFAQSSPCWAVMLGFESPVNFDVDAVYIKDSPLAWICRNNSKPGRDQAESWILHASVEWSENHLEALPESVLTLLLAEFNRVTGNEQHKPSVAKAHRWRYAQVARPLRVGALWDGDLRIGLCGDWLGDGRVEGAFLSGIELARRMTNP